MGFRLAAGRELKNKAGSGVLGLWSKGAVAPGLRDEAFGGRQSDEADKPEWASRSSQDGIGILAEIEIKGVRFEFRRIEADRFMMGSPNNEEGSYDDERPLHEVILTRNYWLGTTQVTQEQWKVVMGENPSQFKGDKLPVEQVSWDDCREFSRKINALISGLNSGLPSEAQWEYACRAGTNTAYNDGSHCTKPTGKDPALGKLGWFGDNSDSKSHIVGQKKPNRWGLYDMHGNVDEWCNDWSGDYPTDSVTDPTGPAKGGGRVLRGGSWFNPAGFCRSAARFWLAPGSRGDGVGFRLAAGLELKEQDQEQEPVR